MKLKELWSKILEPDSKLRLLLFAVLFLFIMVAMKFMACSDNLSPDFSLSSKIESLKDSYSYFENASDKEKFVRWVDLYYQRRYSQQRRWGTYDCSSAIVNYLNSFGANIKDENVEAIKYRVEKLNSLNLIEIRKNYNDVKLWDLIIFTPSSSGNWHIGIIYEKVKGMYGYLDMNGLIDTMGVYYVKYNDYRIDKIVGISFSLWAGDLLENYK